MASNDRQAGGVQTQTGAAGGDRAEAVLAKWTENVGRRDVTSVLSLYAPDAILVPTMSDEVRTSEQARRSYFESFLATEGLQCGITDRRTRVNAERGTVAIGGLYCFKMRKDGRDELVPARFLFTFEEIGGQWLITSHHSSQAVE